MVLASGVDDTLRFDDSSASEQKQCQEVESIRCRLIVLVKIETAAARLDLALLLNSVAHKDSSIMLFSKA